MSRQVGNSSGSVHSLTRSGLLVGLGLVALELILGDARNLAATGSWRIPILFLFVALAAGFALASVGAVVQRLLRSLPSDNARTTLAAGTTFAVVAWMSSGLFEGPKAQKLPLVFLYPWGLGLLAGAGVAGTARALHKRPLTIATTAIMMATVAFGLDAHFHRGRYPDFHNLCAFLTTSGLVLGSALVSARIRWPGVIAGRVIAGAAVTAGILSGITIADDPGARAELSLRTVQLRRVAWFLPSLDGSGPVDVSRDNPTSRAHATAAELHALHVDRRSDTPRPSILLITIDALRADRGPGSTRRPRVAPRLDAWASKGVVFTRAYTAAVTTYISMRSLATGRYPDTFLAEDLIAQPEVLPGLLHARGYETNFWSGIRALDKGQNQWMDTFEGAFDSLEQDENMASTVRRLRELRARTDDRPWFTWCHIMEVHHPYVPPEKYRSGDRLVDLYDGQVRWVDDVIVPEIEAFGDDVWVIVTADHGEEMPEEHGFTSHGSSLYEPAIRIPLIVKGPGVNPGTIGNPVSLVDLFATVLGLAGDPRPPISDGLSLVPALFGQADHLERRPAIFAERRYITTTRTLPRPMRALITNDMKIIANEDPPSFEAYDLVADASERSNLFLHDRSRADALRAQLPRRFQERLQRWESREDLSSILLDEKSDPAALLALSRSESPESRRLALKLLARRAPPELKSTFQEMVTGDDPLAAAFAAVALGHLAGENESWPAALALEGSDELARDMALQILIQRPQPELAPILVDLVDRGRPAYTFKPVIALNMLGHRMGMVFLKHILRRPMLYPPGTSEVLLNQPNLPRPELPSLVEGSLQGLYAEATMLPCAIEAVRKAPGEKSWRVLSRLEQDHGHRVIHGVDIGSFLRTCKTEMRERMAAIRNNLLSTQTGDSWQDEPFPVAWEIADGVSFVVPSEGALVSEEWNPPHDLLPLRALSGAKATITLPVPDGRPRPALLQVGTIAPARIHIACDGAVVFEGLIPTGPTTISMDLPAAAETTATTREIVLELKDTTPTGIGFRELVLLPAR